MPLTNDQVTAAINTAAFADEIEFATLMKVAKLLVQRNALVIAQEKKRKDQAAANAAAEQAVQALQAQINTLDAALQAQV